MDSEKNLKSSTVVEAMRLPGADVSTVGGAARGLAEAREVYYLLRGYQEECRRRLREESDRLGQRTFEVGGYKVVVDTLESALQPSYDVDALWAGLKAAGCPVERLNAAIYYEAKVDGTVIRQLAKNPAYKAVIDAATTGVSEKTRRVEVK